MSIEFANTDPRFEFVDELPGTTSGPNRAYEEFARALREAPGRWAKMPKQFTSPAAARTCTSQIKAGTYKNFPKGEFDAATRGGISYVRFIGGNK